MADGELPHVLVMAKAPVPGRVKTRLCPPCSPEDAAAIAEAALRDTFAVVDACPGVRRLVALDGPAGPWIPAGWTVFPQVAGSFDARLAAAWQVAGGPGIQIGMDTPHVTPDQLQDVLSVLRSPHVDAVLGPALDGGWWVIGLRVPHPEVFRGVAMSTAQTGAAQLGRLRSLGLRVQLVEPLRDLDTIDDALSIAAVAPASRTASVVRGLAVAVS